MHKWLQTLTLFSGTVFHALSHSVICFAQSVSHKNHFLTGGNSLTAKQKLLLSWISKLTRRAKWSLSYLERKCLFNCLVLGHLKGFLSLTAPFKAPHLPQTLLLNDTETRTVKCVALGAEVPENTVSGTTGTNLDIKLTLLIWSNSKYIEGVESPLVPVRRTWFDAGTLSGSNYLHPVKIVPEKL